MASGSPSTPTAAVVVDWQFGQVATDFAETSMFDVSMMGTIGTANASEDTVIEPSDDPENWTSFYADGARSLTRRP